MIVAMQESATDEQIQQVVEHLVRMGFSVHRTTGERQTVLAAVGARVDFDTRNLEVLSGVEHVHRISPPYNLAGRSFRPQRTLVDLSPGVTVAGDPVYDHDLGLAYSVAHDLHLYYVTFRDILQWALRHGYRRYRTSPFNYEPKMHLRLQLEPVDLFVRHRSPWLNFLLRDFAPRFAPARSEAVLRRFYPDR